MSVKTMDKSLDRWFVEVTQVGGCLSGLLSEHERLRIDESESVNNDLSFHRLNWVYNDGNGSGGKLLEGLLSVDIDAGKPAAETGVRMVPSDDGLRSTKLVCSQL